MADDPQAVTAPAQTATAPPPAAPPEFTDAITPGSASDVAAPQMAGPYMLAPASAAEPQPVTLPPAPVEHHLSLMGRILDKVGSILGGDTTYRLTKAADGSMSIAPEPSSMGEKWGRVAAAALGGLAAGAPQSFGPAGVAGGAAAGFQAGVQQPIQQRQQQEQAVDFQNKQLLAKANRVFLQQKMVQQILTNQALGIQMDQDEVERADQLQKDLNASPWHDNVGIFKDMNTAMQAAQTDPQLLKDHAQAKHKIIPVYNRDRTLKGYQVYNVDPSYNDMWNDQPLPVHKITLTPDAEGVLKPTSTVVGTVRPHGTQMGPYNAAEDKHNTDMLAAQEKYSTTKKNLRDEKEGKAPTTYEAAVIQKYQKMYPNDPTRALTEATAEMKAAEQRRFAPPSVTINQGMGAVAPGTQAADLIKPGARFAPGTVEGVSADKLASGDLTLDEMPKRGGRGQVSPAEWVAAAEAYSQKNYGLPYQPVLIDQEKRAFDNQKNQGILNGIDKMIGVEGDPGGIGYLDRVIDLAQRAGIGENAPLNEIQNAVKNKLGDTAYKEFNTALGEVQRSLPSLIGNPMLGGSDSDLKLRQAEQMLGQNPTLSNIRGQAQVLKDMLNGTLRSMVRNNRYLQRRYPTIMGKASPWIKDTRTNITSTAGPTGPSANQPRPKGNVSITRAMQLPQNQGKTRQQVEADIRNSGWTPIP